MATSELNANQKKSLKKLVRVMETLRNTQKDMEVQQMLTLIHAMLGEGSASVTELAERTGTSLSAVSRHVIDFSDLDRNVNGVRRDGLNLIQSTVDPMHRSRKIVSLKPKGKKLLNDLVEIMEG